MSLLIFRRQGPLHLAAPRENNYEIKVWRPTLFSWRPPGKGSKYFAYTLYYFLGLFGSKDYLALFLFDGPKTICSLLVVPKYYKWPFMGRGDVQITYVVTDKKFRGRGIAEYAIRQAIELFNGHHKIFWYVTDQSNTASTNLCKKIGFELVGNGERRGLLKKIDFVKNQRN